MKIDFTSSGHTTGGKNISNQPISYKNSWQNCCPDLTMNTEIFKLQKKGCESEPINVNVKPKSLVIILNTEKSFCLSLGKKEEKKIEAFEYLILNGDEYLPVKVLPQKNQKTEIYVLAINSDAVQKSIKKCGIPLFKQESFIYSNGYNLRIAQHLRYINPTQEHATEMMNSLGHAHIIMGLLLELLIEQQNEKQQLHTSLRKWELDQLLKISSVIKEKPEGNYRVDDLARQTGINIPRLQKGFKEMHGHTVADYIRDIRLKKAEELFRTTDLNVSEVVYSVGLTSRSYFSRIFKKKYHCSPSQYQRNKNLSQQL